MRRIRITGIAVTASAVMLIGAAIAWACTPSAYLYPVNPGRGPAGAEVTLRGGQFGTGPVEIRWASESGRLLTTTMGPEFTTTVTIPDRPEGVYYLVAVARDPANPSIVLGRRAEAFEITTNPRAEARAAASSWADSRQPAGEEGGFPAAMAMAVGLGLMTAGAALSALVFVRRRKAHL